MNRKWKGFLLLILLLPLFSFYFFRGADFIRIPVLFFPESPSAYIEVDLEGNTDLLKIDTGAPDPFSFKRKVLEAIRHKHEQGVQEWVDINGNHYQTPIYLIDLLRMGKMTITNMAAKEEDPAFSQIGSVIPVLEKASGKGEVATEIGSGRIGARFFRAVDYWLIDFPRKALFAIRSVEKAQQNVPFSLDHFIEVPLEPFHPHLVIAVETSYGKKTFVLDTGATCSILRPSSLEQNHQEVNMDRFVINGHNFGIKKLYLFQFSDEMKFDGFLGQDFLKYHTIFVDFKKNKIWIDSKMSL